MSYQHPFHLNYVTVTSGDSDSVKVPYCCNFYIFNPKRPVNIFYGKINERFDIPPDRVQVIFFPYFNQSYDRVFYKTFLWKVIEQFYSGQSISYNTFPIYDIDTLRDMHKIVYYDYKL